VNFKLLSLAVLRALLLMKTAQQGINRRHYEAEQFYVMVLTSYQTPWQ